MVEMHLAGVRVELPTNTPVVLLQELEGLRTLPIYIGTAEATSIAYAMQGVVTPRPMTHDLMHTVIDVIGAEVEGVVITELRDGTYLSEIHIRQGEQLHSISSRPSDALALAVRMGTPIFADDALVDAEGIVLPLESDDGQNAEELVTQFREFIKDVRPEDFSSGGAS